MKGVSIMPIKSDAQRRAVAKYNASNYDRVELRMKKGKKEAVKEYAERSGKSLNEFINEAIDKAMQE